MLCAGVATLADVLVLADADPSRAPLAVREALAGVVVSKRDRVNGGLAQFVWNHGARRARDIGRAWCKVGAVDNGELLCALADELDTRDTPEADDAVEAFIHYGKAVGPLLRDVPSVTDELDEAIVEWSLEHPELFG